VTNNNYMDVEDLEPLAQETAVYGVNDESFPHGCMPPDTRNLKPNSHGNLSKQQS
jgi:hypothetical protein